MVGRLAVSFFLLRTDLAHVQGELEGLCRVPSIIPLRRAPVEAEQSTDRVGGWARAVVLVGPEDVALLALRLLDEALEVVELRALRSLSRGRELPVAYVRKTLPSLKHFLSIRVS